MDKHTFEMKQEALNGQIRAEKIRALQYDVQTEKFNADGKMYHAATAKTRAQIAQTDSITETVKLSQARSSQQMERLKLTGSERDVKHEQRLSLLKGQAQDTQYDGLKTDLTTAQKMLANRKALLTSKVEI